jgi:two-component system, chemotaxis family, CheB/CheR fusion protein
MNEVTKSGTSGEDPSDSTPVIVAVGASAGGIQALQTFVGELPERSGAAFVIVVHLDPSRRSELANILSARTKIPVIEVGDRQRLEANRIYVIPPDRRLQVTDHEISAAPFEEPRGHRSPIDSFFRSLADQLGDGFAVILSGAGSDGAIGVRAIKEAGGIILVQDPSEAEYSSMPRSAIATGVADFILPAKQLAKRLGDLIALKHTMPETSPAKFDDEILRRILAHLRARTGHDFSKYKKSTVVRRIARRMQVTRTDELVGYYDLLRENSDEAQALLGDLLISVTTFFRDPEAFEVLAQKALPAIFADKDASRPIRAWVCGCATGEEAYTLAMLLLEEAARHEVRPPIQVFGSDLDTRALAAARDGRFPAAIEADVREDRLRRFFQREGDHYRIGPEVRDVVLFALHDFLKDPPFSHVDLISCRNVLIYLDRDLQEQVCTTFHYALNPGGFLFLGASETADNPPGLFRTIDRTARLFQSTALQGERARLLPRLLNPIRVREQAVQLPAITPVAALTEAALHRKAIEQIAPPSILVDETHRVVHLSDNAGRYLLPGGGPLSGDLGDLARPELRFELRSSLDRAFEQRLSTLSLPIPVQFNGAAHRVMLLVKPVNNDGNTPHALVIFVEGEALDETVSPPEQPVGGENAKRLKQELELTQQRLRTVREESDAANEELRAANEELQSINEEYRSTSEELETSKEELQSINEELQTVNSELKLKLDVVSRAHSDLQNLMAATDFGTLFLDPDLRIKRFTDRVTDLFSLTPHDEGRQITDFANQLNYEHLLDDIRSVLENLTPIRREIESRAGRWYDLRLRPYRTVDNKIDGIVLSFVDVSERRKVEDALRESQHELMQQKQLLDVSRDPIFVWDFDGGIVEWNRGSEELYGYSQREALGKSPEQVLRTVVPGSTLDAMRKILRENGSWSGELEQTRKDGRRVTVESRLQLQHLDGKALVLETTRDVSDRKIWEQRQRLLLSELTHRVKNTLSVVQSVANQTLRTTTSVEDFVDRFGGRIAALGRAHDLLVQSDWHGADLGALARRQLGPYISDNPDRLRIDGEPVSLPPDLATPFGLVLHELATNAAKYGSLRDPKGTVHLSWTVSGRNGQRHLKVSWREKDGGLIENGIADAKVKRDYLKDGLLCTIEVPLPGNSHDDGGVYTA